MITVTTKHQPAKMSAFDDVVIEIAGHALEAPYGHDIVCAGVSTLYDMLANHIVNSSVTDIDGRVTMIINGAVRGNLLLVQAFTDTIERLSAQYPDNVRLNKAGD